LRDEEVRNQSSGGESRRNGQEDGGAFHDVSRGIRKWQIVV
jgi:hypothetical protein